MFTVRNCANNVNNDDFHIFFLNSSVAKVGVLIYTKGTVALLSCNCLFQIVRIKKKEIKHLLDGK